MIERALLQEWAEHHLRTDPDLSTVRAADRDALVSEYRELDRALIAAATGSIIRACNARRPRSDVGEAAVIRREAEKKKKHMPVRTLLERTRHVTQAIKPCFMMSPLAVSQYLPAGPALRRRHLRRGQPGQPRRRHQLHLPRLGPDPGRRPEAAAADQLLRRQRR